MEDTSAATLERPEDAGPPPRGVVSRWLMELRLASKEEEEWRKEAKRVVDLFRNEKDDGKGTVRNSTATNFNILWSNTLTLLPALYNSTPKPDVRRRFRDNDPVGKAVSEVLQRCLGYELDAYDFDAEMEGCVLDMLLPGRAVARVRYEPVVTGGVIQSQDVTCEVVDWDRFRRGPGRRWKDVQWIAFEHRMTRDELDALIGEEKAAAVPLEDDEAADSDEDDVPGDVFRRAIVWEIWSKETREILWISPRHKDDVLRKDADPLRLKGFFPIPRPLYSNGTTTSLVPKPEYCMYETQAKELDRVTQRINSLIKACRVRGVYNSTMSEIRRLLEDGASDNELIPAENVAMLMETGGLEKHIWLMPIDKIAQVLVQLYTQRDQIKTTIYEITGISDILRGASVASETATAQEIKSNWGTLRLSRRQREVARFARDLMRIKAELIAEHFEPQTLQAMSGVQLMQGAEKQALMAQAQAASSQGQEIPPQVQQQLMAPSWDDVMSVLRSDQMRGYRVDVETDSTIAAALTDEQRNITELLQGIVQFLANVGPAVQSGAMPIDTAKALLLAAVRRFRLGNEVEDALEALQAPKGMPPELEAQIADARKQVEAKAQQLQAQEQQIAKAAQAESAKAAERELQFTQREMRLKVGEERLSMREQFDQARKAAESEIERVSGESQSAVDALKGQAEEATDQAISQAVGTLAQTVEQVFARAREQDEKIDQLAQMVAQAVQMVQGLGDRMAGREVTKTTKVRDGTGRMVRVVRHHADGSQSAVDSAEEVTLQ